MEFNYITNELLSWYPENRRDLPWRGTNDPYIIWLSEVILQQTRVAQGLPYFYSFLEKFPKIEVLAAASEDEIMRTWQGLGYYSRARNLHQCAKDIVAEHKGIFPGTFDQLLKLKGVGSYTAAAIASFAFRERVAVLDGNVFRVLARFFGLEEDISSGKGKKVFQALANKIISSEEPDTFNQAIMEFGALQCVPKNPNCSVCVLRDNCFAHQKGLVNSLPVKSKRVKVSERYFLYFHIECEESTVVNKREGKDIWKGLVDFPLHEANSINDLMQPKPENMSVLQELSNLGAIFDFPNEPPIKHVLTHQRIYASFVRVTVPNRQLNPLKQWAEDHKFELVTLDDLEVLGKPRLIEKYLNQKK